MPRVGDPLTTGEIDTLRAWLATKTPEKNQANAPIDVSAAILNDVRAIAAQSQGTLRLQSIRYVVLTHDPSADAETLHAARIGIAKLLNSLSWQPRLMQPVAIDPSGRILRIDLALLGWNTRSWALLTSAYPYAPTDSTPGWREVATTTGSLTPWVRGDWLSFAASRPPLYHALLGLPETEGGLEAMLRVDAEGNLTRGRALRAGVVGGRVAHGSGVSDHNRLIERHTTAWGAYWKSYDFAASGGAQNIFERPFGPLALEIAPLEHRFVHDGGEFIFNLPNGLQGYMIADRQGKRLDRAPSIIVRDKTDQNREVINGVSCMACHSVGVRRQKDQLLGAAAKHRTGPLGGLLTQWHDADALEQAFDTDQARFEAALRALGATPTQISGPEMIATLSRAHEAPVDLQQAAWELRVSQDVLRDVIQGGIVLGLDVETFEGGVTRDTFATHFARLQEATQAHSVTPTQAPSDMVAVPGAAFWLGPPTATAPGQQHVTLSAFQIDRHKVSVADYRRCVAAGVCVPPPADALSNEAHPGRDEHPINALQWAEAQTFCAWQGKRLPTEAEWALAARGPSSLPFPWGHDRPTCELAVLAGCGNGTQRVDALPASASPYGAIQMIGNVSEWTADRFTDAEGVSRALLRGQSFMGERAESEAWRRTHAKVDDRYAFIGFRCAR